MASAGNTCWARVFDQSGRESINEFTETNEAWGLSTGFGLTMDLRGDVFLRPEVKVKFLVPGPVLLVVPAVGVGYRF